MKIRKSIIGNIILMIVISCLIVLAISSMLGLYTKHNEEITIPNIRGLKIDKAIKKLSDKDLDYEIVDSVYRSDLEHGIVIETLPREGMNVKEGRKIYLTITSFSTMQGVVPRVENLSSRQAIAQLNSLKFHNITIREVSGDFDNLCIRLETINGNIIPSGTKISVDTRLVLVVSKRNNSDSSAYYGSSEENANVDNDWL